MNCPTCRATDSVVIDSREWTSGTVVRRRRRCPACDARWTTWESAARPADELARVDAALETADRAALLLEQVVREARRGAGLA